MIEYRYSSGGSFMRYLLDHWPELLLWALILAGCWTAVQLPVSLWARISLIPVGVFAGFAAWFAIVFVGVRLWFSNFNHDATPRRKEKPRDSRVA